DELAPVEPVEALGEQGSTPEAGEGLRAIDPEPLTRARGGAEPPRRPHAAARAGGAAQRRGRPDAAGAQGARRSPLRPSAWLATSASAARPSTGRRSTPSPPCHLYVTR